MLESKDPAIKLFGQEIPLQGEDEEVPIIAGDDLASPVAIDVDREGGEEEEEEDEGDRDDGGQKGSEEEEDESDKESLDGIVTESPKEKEAETPLETNNLDTLPEAGANPKTPSIEEETAKSKKGKSEKDQTDATNSQEKILKKPDKLLPCPRCNSMDTKFCYYNNYNINQPRHFCRACQRYWTAGGTMRNVPVGAGRRKNKNSTSNYRHITISEALQAARIDAPNGTNLPTLKTNGRVLSFGLDAPICDSMASVLNLAEKNGINNRTRNGYHSFENQGIPVPCKSVENGDDCTSPSSVEESGKSITLPESLLRNNGFPQIPCLPGVHWPYPSPAVCPPGFPMSFYPAAFWNFGVPLNWNVPWFSPHSSAPTPMSPSSGPNSPTLGKHSRDGDLLKPDYLQKEEASKQRNGCVLVPKILRIDDPSEAAKSSIWATLGIKNESVSRRGMFKAFESKKDENKDGVETPSVLRANPAALSRSLNFHENS